MLSKNIIIIRLIAIQVKNISFYKMNYYTEPDSQGRNKIKVQSDLSNYATKSEVKKATGVDTSDYAFVDLLDIDKLKRYK